MKRTISMGMMLVAFVSFARAADGVSIILVLEGTLTENQKRFYVTAGGEPAWTLDMSAYHRQLAAAKLKPEPSVKVLVTGRVTVRTTGNQIVLVDRILHVEDLSFSVPGGQRVTAIVAGSPAHNRLAVNDIIIEIDGKPITTKEKFLEILAAQQGKIVTIVVVRDGGTLIVEGIKLQEGVSRLGVNTEQVLNFTGIIVTGGPSPK